MTASIALNNDVLKSFGDAQIRFVVARGLQNGSVWKAAASELDDLERRVASGKWAPYTEDQPEIASWHQAYRSFGTNPRKFRPSVDALSRRLSKSGHLPRINPAVDAYNLVSVMFGVPAGAFDLDRLSGRVDIRLARPGDTFVPLGEPSLTEEPRAGELVYAQKSEVLTRHWNHRDCDHTKVTPESVNIVFIMERISRDAMPDSRLAEAQAKLAKLIRPHADDVTLAVIDNGRPFTKLGKGEPESVSGE